MKWDAIEIFQRNAFVNEVLGHPYSKKSVYDVYSDINYQVYKRHDSWLAALK